jgi:hypothetical protein
LTPLQHFRRFAPPTVLALGLAISAAVARAEVATLDINPNNFYIYVSAPGNGNVAGITYADEDILRYDPATNAWVKVFDGTNAGLPAAADIDALAYNSPQVLANEYYLSFDAPTNVPTLGTVDDSDVVRFSTFLGGSGWTLIFDGSAYGLTTSAEDVDGLDLDSANLVLSTTGNFTVPKAGGGNLTGGDEDVILFGSSLGKYILRWDGSTAGLLGKNDTRSLAYYRDIAGTLPKEYLFLAFQQAFNLNEPGFPTLSGVPNDIHARQYGPPNATGKFWDASDAGFPKVDAFDAVRK